MSFCFIFPQLLGWYWSPTFRWVTTVEVIGYGLPEPVSDDNFLTSNEHAINMLLIILRSILW